VQDGKLEIVALLIKYGANITALNADNQTPLNIANDRREQNIIKIPNIFILKTFLIHII